MEFATEETVTPELIAKRVWTPELVAEEAWPLEDAEDETATPDPAGEVTLLQRQKQNQKLLKSKHHQPSTKVLVEPVLATNDFWTFEPAVTDNVPSANVDADYPPVVEQIMQIRPAASNPINQQLSLPLQDVQSVRIAPEVAALPEAPPAVSEVASTQHEAEEESIDFTPSKVVSLPQRASGIVRELVEEEIPEIAFDVEPESESQSKLNAEDNSWAGTKHAKANDDSTLLHGKQRLNNVVNTGPSDMQRRKRPPRNITRERPSPGFPPTQQ